MTPGRTAVAAAALVAAAFAQAPSAVLNPTSQAADGIVNVTWGQPATGTVTSYRSEARGRAGGP
jgi:hypothetical protein